MLNIVDHRYCLLLLCVFWYGCTYKTYSTYHMTPHDIINQNVIKDIPNLHSMAEREGNILTEMVKTFNLDLKTQLYGITLVYNIFCKER